MKNKKFTNLIIAALFLALGLLLPFLTGQIKQIGNMLLPMHLPVMLCGLICGWHYGLAVGFLTPLLRSMLFGMPPMYPTAIAMAFELATYGLLVGLIFRLFRKKTLWRVYAALLPAMVGGRMVWGIAQVLLLGLGDGGFTYTAFCAGAILNALPGILLQLILIPTIMLALFKTKLKTP